jgi:5-methylcytosine-specific restriction protein A
MGKRFNLQRKGIGKQIPPQHKRHPNTYKINTPPTNKDTPIHKPPHIIYTPPTRIIDIINNKRPQTKAHIKNMTPWKPASRCATNGCPELTHKARCPKHSREIEQKRREKEHWRDYGPEWRIIRKKILRAEPNCRNCGQPATEVDHIKPLKEGGTHDLENLRPLCKSCHSRRTYYDTLHKK